MFIACFVLAFLLALSGFVSPKLVGKPIKTSVGSPQKLALGLLLEALFLIAVTYVWQNSHLSPAWGDFLGVAIWLVVILLSVWSIVSYAKNHVYTRARSVVVFSSAVLEVVSLAVFFFA